MTIKRISTNIFLRGAGIFFSTLTLAGCSSSIPNGGQMEIYRMPTLEAEWIQNGDPIDYDGKLWAPTDSVENLLDSEVYLKGEYRGVQFFVDKTDVKPYGRLYTKFGHNRYRAFQTKEKDDK